MIIIASRVDLTTAVRPFLCLLIREIISQVLKYGSDILHKSISAQEAAHWQNPLYQTTIAYSSHTY